MNIDDVKKLVEPPAPKLPPNPIDAAEKEYERKMNPMVDLANYFACVQPSYSFDAINSSFLSNRLDTKITVSILMKTVYSQKIDNSLTKMQKLLTIFIWFR